MIRISGPKIQDVAAAIDGQTIAGVRYRSTGKIQGIQALFTSDAPNEESAADSLKKHLKQTFPLLRLYIEVV